MINDQMLGTEHTKFVNYSYVVVRPDLYDEQ